MPVDIVGHGVYHFRYFNKVILDSGVLSIVFRPVYVMPPWAFNEGYIVEKAKMECDFNRLTYGPLAKENSQCISSLRAHNLSKRGELECCLLVEVQP